MIGPQIQNRFAKSNPKSDHEQNKRGNRTYVGPVTTDHGLNSMYRPPFTTSIHETKGETLARKTKNCTEDGDYVINYKLKG